MKRTALLLTVAASFFAAGITGASACSCMRLDENEWLERADVVFEGTVLDSWEETDPESGESWGRLVTNFAIKRTLKGNHEKARRIHHYENNGANCGQNFDETRIYRVYATESEGVLTTNSCHPNTVLD